LNCARSDGLSHPIPLKRFCFFCPPKVNWLNAVLSQAPLFQIAQESRDSLFKSVLGEVICNFFAYG
jgi:hypothetical protein